MKRILIFGNSGSGKSTLARQLGEQHGIAHLDLDVLAWLPVTPPQRKPLAESEREISRFIDSHEEWVIEGCYADLLTLVAAYASEMIFLNPGIEQCIANCRNRPWEQHKYASREEQDRNLDMLIDWVKQYPDRTDEFSLQAHMALFNAFSGNKMMHTENTELV